MPNHAPEALNKWVARLIADVTEEGAVSRFELVHGTSDGAERIGVVRMKGGGDDDAHDVAQMLFSDAEQDTETREGNSGSERYVILAFRSDDADAEAQYPFRIARKKRWAGDDTEAPTEKGQTAQTMRHLNENHNIMMRFTEVFGGRIASELERETKRRQDAEERVAKMREENEDFKDRQLDREILRASLLQKEKFMGDLMQSCLPLLPMIAGALIGRFGPQEKNGKHSSVAKLLTPSGSGLAEREMQLKTFFAHLSPTEVEGLQEAIKPMNRIALGEIFFAVQRADEAQRPAIDVSIQKFLKALSSEEIMGVMQLLEPANRERFMAIYKAYGEIELKQQAELPEALRDSTPAPAES